ncbi:hypothetical protein CONLIGDRAFT_266765 [Coniochaeta ligniaria NRRL 30616]|uniref:Uncharacterized protein n=1 Tax=Coniochaeta ligniaria NRRL 30616 TaxID=1408157 RepID=A0A1J7IXB2_9PEZI|nr:hypothetical protein CONLIGDRAFT_266765 [Coniochaeta ligniaria NRRL 30616]
MAYSFSGEQERLTVGMVPPRWGCQTGCVALNSCRQDQVLHGEDQVPDGGGHGGPDWPVRILQKIPGPKVMNTRPAIWASDKGAGSQLQYHWHRSRPSAPQDFHRRLDCLFSCGIFDCDAVFLFFFLYNLTAARPRLSTLAGGHSFFPVPVSSFLVD